MLSLILVRKERNELLFGRERNKSAGRQSFNISCDSLYHCTVCIRRELKQKLPYTGGVPGITDATVGQRNFKSRANWTLKSSNLSC